MEIKVWKDIPPAKQEKQESLFGITTKAAAHALKETTSEITSEEARLLKYIKLFTNWCIGGQVL